MHKVASIVSNCQLARSTQAWCNFCATLFPLFHCGWGTNPSFIPKKTLKAVRPCKASLGLITFSEHIADTQHRDTSVGNACVGWRARVYFVCCGSGASSKPQCVLFSRVPGLKCNFIQSHKLGFLLY